jgi:hypothetical protein
MGTALACYCIILYVKAEHPDLSKVKTIRAIYQKTDEIYEPGNDDGIRSGFSNSYNFGRREINTN